MDTNNMGENTMNTYFQEMACKELWMGGASVGFHPDMEIVVRETQKTPIKYFCGDPWLLLDLVPPDTVKACISFTAEVSDAKAFAALEVGAGRTKKIKVCMVDGTILVGRFIITAIGYPDNDGDAPYAVTMHATTDFWDGSCAIINQHAVEDALSARFEVGNEEDN